ncbi:MAG: class I SAM-dependent methyltransferase [Opitutae bacterium]|nr:class I SAM-dependent methyltransferase [Opitutae bacterium]
MHDDEYRKMADVEDVMWYYRALHRHVAAALRGVAEPDARILDAGCGTGGLLRRLAATSARWRLEGLDFSAIAVEAARVRTGLPVTLGSVTALPFADGQFDAVVSCDVVCQVPDGRAALAEFRRVLKPGGALVLTMPAYRWMHSYHDRQVGNLWRCSRGELNELLRASGLRPTWSSYWNTTTFPLAVVRRKLFPAPEGASDVFLFPPAIERAFDVLMQLENVWLRTGSALPFGSSVIVVARGVDRAAAAW